MHFRISDFGFRIIQPPPLNVAWVGGHSEFSSYCSSLEFISVIENSVLVRRIER